VNDSKAWALFESTTNTVIVDGDTQANTETQKLLNELQWLALPISQAGAFMASMSASDYLALLSNDNHRWANPHRFLLSPYDN
jgi:hypothetical protein